MQSSFVSGELSPLLKGRVDLEQYYQGMETAENVLIVPQGGLKRRAGTQHIDEGLESLIPYLSSDISGTQIQIMPNGGTAANINDFNSATVATTTTVGGIGILGTTGQPNYVVAYYDLSSISNIGSQRVYFIDVKNIQLTGSGSAVFKIQHSPNGVNWNSETITVTDKAQSVRFAVSTTGLSQQRYFRILRSGDTGNLGSVQLELSEFNILYNNGSVSDLKTFDFSIETNRHYLCAVTGGSVNDFYFTISSGTAVLNNTYTVNGSTYLVTSINGSIIRTRRTVGETTPSATGTLAGTPTLTYSAVVNVPAIGGNMSIYYVPETLTTSLTSSNWTPVANLIVPFKSSEVAAVRDVQTENVMLMFHENHAPIRIINTGGNVFAIDEIPFLNVPQYDYNDSQSPVPEDYITIMTLGHFAVGDRFQIDVEGVLSKNITLTDDPSSSAANIQRNLQEMPIFGDTGVAVTGGNITFTITVSGESTKSFKRWSGFATLDAGSTANTVAFALSQQGKPRKENVWGGVYAPDSPNAGQIPGRGFPKTAAFHEGRLWLGGTKSKLQSLFASRSSSFFDFYTEEGDADEGIFTTISSRQLTEILDVNPDRGLQVFTAGAEFVVNGSTPADISIQAQTQHGAANLEVKSVDGATLFVDQNGRTLRSYLYNFNEDAYNSTDISVLSSQLIDNPKDLGILTGSLSEDANWVFIVNQDGTSAILNTLRSQDINGFTKWINGNTNNFSFTISSGTPVLNNSYTVNGSTYLVTAINGSVIETTRLEGLNTPTASGTLSGTPNLVFSSFTYNALETVSVSVVNNDLFLVNKKTTGTTTYTIERWSFDCLLDSSLKLINGNTFAGNNLVLFSDHLNGETVSVVARGNTLPSRKVNSTGSITCTNEEKAFILANGDVIDVEVGYNFIPKIKSMPLNTAAPAGQNQMREKKINRMNLRVYESSGVYIDGNPVAIRQFGDAANSPLDSNLPEQTGIIEDNNGGNGWGIEVQPIITVPEPTPFHIQAIEYEVESS